VCVLNFFNFFSGEFFHVFSEISQIKKFKKSIGEKFPEKETN
jgi:hypothetical protein